MKEIKLLVGGVYKVKLTKQDYSTTDVAPYPNWYNVKIPIKVLREYDKYYLVKVLPHDNPTLDMQCGLSKPYNVTIDKHHLNTRIFVVVD